MFRLPKAPLTALLTAILLTAGGCRCADPAPTTTKGPKLDPAMALAKVQREEWRRDIAPGWLRQLLAASDARLRARGALAIGRVGHGASLSALLPLLGDAVPTVRRSTGFALRLLVLDSRPGARAKRRALAALRQRLTSEGDPDVKAELLTTLGWIGDASDAASITSAFRGELRVRIAALTAWGLLARRGHLGAAQTTALSPLLGAPKAPVRRQAAWAAAQAPAGPLPTAVHDKLRTSGAGDKDIPTRVWATVALAKRPRRSMDWLLARYQSPYYRVQLAAAHGLGRSNLRAKVKLTQAIKRVWRHVGANHFRLTGPRLHAVVAGLRALEGRASVATLRQLAEDMLELADASDAAVRYRPLQALSIDHVHCAAARLWDFGSKRVDRSPTCGTARAPQLGPRWRQRFVAGVIAAMPARDARWKQLLLRRYLRAKEPEIRSAAQGALARANNPDVGAALSRGLADADPRVFHAAASAVRVLAMDLQGHDLDKQLHGRLQKLNPLASPENVCAATAALGRLRYREALPLLQRLRQSPLWGVRDCASAALSAMGRRAEGKPAPPSRGLPDLRWDHDRSKELPRRAMLVTRRGEVEIELYPERAPAAVAFFARWAHRRRFQRSYFDTIEAGRRVIVGGRMDGLDPRAQRLPCELTPSAFERGSLGLVLPAGRDSAGVRFFVSLRRSPELDGRRTLFGKVLRGIEQLESLQPGETVKDLYIPKPAKKSPDLTKRTDKTRPAR